jgi:tetratricopeptide (TPR) repeat protein
MKTILTVLAAALLAVAVSAQSPVPLHIAAGDAAYAKFDDQAALARYRAALALEPSNYEALYKASRALINIADVVTAKGQAARKGRLALYAEAAVLARRAVKANPGGTYGHFLIAAAEGKRVLELGVKEQVEAAREIKAEIDQALLLDPANHLAWDALGVWHRRIAEISRIRRLLGGIFIGSIPKGSMAESERALRRAVELDPAFVNHYLELGRTLADEGDLDEAAEIFRKAMAIPKTNSEDDVLKAQAQEELDKLTKRRYSEKT